MDNEARLALRRQIKAKRDQRCNTPAPNSSTASLARKNVSEIKKIGPEKLFEEMGITDPNDIQKIIRAAQSFKNPAQNQDEFAKYLTSLILPYAEKARLGATNAGQGQSIQVTDNASRLP